MTQVDEVIRWEIARRGPIPFEEVVAAALYDPTGGFYATGGRAGRQGDFLTSPEVGPLFGAVVARALDRWWHASGAPEVFVVIEAGAGVGMLARTILAASPACAPALRYALVEQSTLQRAEHAARLELEDPAAAVAPSPATDPSATGPAPPGPIVVSLEELPRVAGPCVVIANELLDNVPFGLAERTEDGWSEVRVGRDGDRLVEVLVPLTGTVADGLPAAAPGARVPRQQAAAAWVHDAIDLAGAGGRVVAIDYASTTVALSQRPWTEWVRTYRGHGRGGPPLEALGTQDITCEVAADQLPTPSSDRSQAAWLQDHGIEELVEEGRRIWEARAAIGDLAAVRARSRVTEADALLDPAGLGAFRVLEWTP